MATKLDGTLKRELRIGGDDYTLTLTPESLVLSAKGRRTGLTIAWADLISGEAALANALNASLTAKLEPATKRRRPLRLVGRKTVKKSKR